MPLAISLSLQTVSMRFDQSLFDLVLTLIKDGKNTAQTAESVKLSQQTLQRLLSFCHVHFTRHDSETLAPQI